MTAKRYGLRRRWEIAVRYAKLTTYQKAFAWALASRKIRHPRVVQQARLDLQEETAE